MVNLIIQWQIKLAPSIFYIQPSQYSTYVGVIGRRDDSLSTFVVYYENGVKGYSMMLSSLNMPLAICIPGT